MIPGGWGLPWRWHTGADYTHHTPRPPQLQPPGDLSTPPATLCHPERVCLCPAFIEKKSHVLSLVKVSDMVTTRWGSSSR